MFHYSGGCTCGQTTWPLRGGPPDVSNIDTPLGFVFKVHPPESFRNQQAPGTGWFGKK